MTRLTAILAVLAAALGGTAAGPQTHHVHAATQRPAGARPASQHANAWAAAIATASDDRGQDARDQHEPGDDNGQDLQAEQEPGDDRGQDAQDQPQPGDDDGQDIQAEQVPQRDNHDPQESGDGDSGHGDNGSDG